MDSRHDLELMTKEEKIAYYTEKSNKMFTYLRGVCADNKHPNLQSALGYARERHKEQRRKSGEPYIIHPLSLACDAVGMYLTDDVLLAMLLLHDIPEDTGTNVMELPVDDKTKAAVERMTFRQMPGESKYEAKKRYYQNLAADKHSMIGKGFDRRNNLSTSAKAMSKASIVKNCFETWFLLIPMLKESKLVYPEYSNQIHTIRTDLTGYVDTLSVLVGIDLSYKNPPDDELMETILAVKTDEDLEKIPEIFNAEKRF